MRQISRVKDKVLVAFLLASTAILIASCHSVRHDDIPQSWVTKSLDTHADCSVITGTYLEQSSDSTKTCYSTRANEQIESACTYSLSLYLAPRITKQPTHVDIMQNGKSELAIRYWSNNLLLQETVLSSEQDEFSCTSDGVRIYKKDDLVVAPPFKSQFEYIYGTFLRASDDTLMMKYSHDSAFLMWGFIPWVSDFSSHWVKWPPRKYGGAKGVLASDKTSSGETMYKNYLSISMKYQSPSAAWRWLCRAADLGYSKAQSEVAYWHHSNAWKYVKPKRLSWLKEAGIRQNNKISYLWYTLAASDDDHDLQTRDKLFSGIFSTDDISVAKEMIDNWNVGQCENYLVFDN